MTTKLEGPLKREINVGDDAYTLTITPEGFVLTLKGRRKGHELTWSSIVSGEAALATALNASLASTAPTMHDRAGQKTPAGKRSKKA
jgi:hypothetical protein